MTALSPELLDEVSWHLEIRDYYPDAAEALVPMHLVRRINEALIWAGDEIAQLREDLANKPTTHITNITNHYEGVRAA